MPRTSIGVTVSDWDKLTLSVTEETTGDAPALRLLHEKLQAFLTEFQQLAQEQSFHAARKQEATRRINEILEEGRKTASALKMGLKLRHGNRSEALVKYGIQPLRPRKRKKKTESPADGEVSS
jgi:hypothetical protein